MKREPLNKAENKGIVGSAHLGVNPGTKVSGASSNLVVGWARWKFYKAFLYSGEGEGNKKSRTKRQFDRGAVKSNLPQKSSLGEKGGILVTLSKTDDGYIFSFCKKRRSLTSKLRHQDLP